MTDLDPKGLEAACIAFLEAFNDLGSTPDDYRKEAEAAIRAYLNTADNGWIDISTAPKDDLVLLSCVGWPAARDGKWPVKVGGYWSGGWNVFGASWIPTHWRPLPSPPKSEPQK